MGMSLRDLPRRWKVTVVVLVVIVIGLGASIVGYGLFLRSYRESCAQQRAQAKKADADLVGTRLSIPRDGKPPVDVDVYVPSDAPSDEAPVVFNIHGGGFVAGDADALDTQSSRISKEWGAIVVSVNYTTADVKPIPYGVSEICDAVRYFRDNASAYHADGGRIVLMGYSAGAYYAAEAARSLGKSGAGAEALVLCYPWTRGLPTDSLAESLPRTMFVLAGQDPISQNAKEYAQRVKDAGVETNVLEYPDARHSFIESNNPEGSEDSAAVADGVVSPEQEEMARDAEAKVGQWLGI